MAFSKSVVRAQNILLCQLCETDSKIQSKCVECQLLMCTNCRDRIHPKFKNAEEHEVLDLQEVRSQGEGGGQKLDFSRIRCQKHQDQEISDLKEASRSSEEEIRKLRKDLSVNELQMKELQDQLEAKQYLFSLYRTQVKDLKDDVEEKNEYYENIKTDLMALEEEKDSIAQQLQLALAKAESEHIALTIAEEQLADVEKEKTVLRLGIKELESRHKDELVKKDSIIASAEDNNRYYSKQVEQLQKDKDAINNRMKSLQDDYKNMQQKTIPDNEMEKLKKILEEERMKKIQAVNKLAEIMNRKEFRNQAKNINHSAEQTSKKKEEDLRILHKELLMEKEKYKKMIEKYARDLSETQAALYDEGQQKARLQMELDSKDSEVEQLRHKLAFVNIDTASFKSSIQEDSENSDVILEGWLAVPNRSNIKKYGWKKQYVVVSSRKVLFYNTESEKQNSDPVLVLDIEKVFHVRQVTQGDVYRAEAKDIPRIFQVLYASEGENRRQAESHIEISPQDKSAVMNYKGHEMIALHYRTQTSCDACKKPVWHLVQPPQALECRHCHTKVHKEHFDRNEEFIGYCKVNYDQNIQAKEMLLLAESADKQKQWIQHLSKKKGIVSSGNLSTLRWTKQYSSFGPQGRQSGGSRSANTLHPNSRPGLCLSSNNKNGSQLDNIYTNNKWCMGYPP